MILEFSSVFPSRRCVFRVQFSQWRWWQPIFPMLADVLKNEISHLSCARTNTHTNTRKRYERFDGILCINSCYTGNRMFASIPSSSLFGWLASTDKHARAAHMEHNAPVQAAIEQSFAPASCALPFNISLSESFFFSCSYDSFGLCYN